MDRRREDWSTLRAIKNRSGWFIVVVGALHATFLPLVLLGWLQPNTLSGQQLARGMTVSGAFLFVLPVVVYGVAIAKRLGAELLALTAEGDAETPVLTGIEVTALLSSVLGYLLTAVFFGPLSEGCGSELATVHRVVAAGAVDPLGVVVLSGRCPNVVGPPPDPATASPVAELFGVYTPLGWQLGTTLVVLAAPMLAVAKAAEAFAFTGDRGG